MQTLFLQVISQHAVLLWHQLIPVIDVCGKVMIIIARLVGLIITGQRLRTWWKHPETFPGFYKIQEVWQQICSLWSRLINLLRR